MANFHDVWIITPDEKNKHDNQFYLMNPVAGFLSGEQVKVFFMQSGLSQNVLGKIWQLSDINADGKMDKKEFSIAMHLIKKALMGFDIPHVLPSSLLSNPPNVAPSFNPVMNPGMVGASYGVVSNSGILYNSSTLPYPAGTATMVAADPRNFATLQKPPTSASMGGEWCITPALRLKYNQLFNNYDASHKGYLTGFEAKGVLSHSGLTHPVLAQIWSLADIDTDGNLSPDEFCVAMFLIDQAKSGFPIPQMLPPDLVPPSYRKSRRPSEPVGMNIPANSPSSTIAAASTMPGQPNPVAPNDMNSNFVATNLNMSGSETNSNNFQECDASKIITFEDKRKENFDKGQAELERRRAMLRDQQLQESEDRLAAERAEQEKREKIRQDQELKKQIELEKQMERQRSIEMEKEEQRRKLLEQKEAARKELERQRQLEWEEQRMNQLMIDRSRERSLVDDLRLETSQQKLQLENFHRKRSELLGKIDQAKMNISDMSNFIQSLKHSSLSKTIEIDVLKAELEEVEMKLVAAQQERLRLGRQVKTPDSAADQGLGNLMKDHSRSSERLEELKKKIEIIEATCRNKKATITQLEAKVEKVRQICDAKKSKNGAIPEMTRHFDSHFTSSDKKNGGNTWDFEETMDNSTSLFDSTVNWPTAFPTDDSTFQENRSESDAWATFGANEQTSGWTADFNSTSNDREPQSDVTPEKYKALYRFEANNPDELSLVEGDIVLVHDRDQQMAEPGWMIGLMDGREGCFPLSYVQKLTSDNIFATNDFNVKFEAAAADLTNADTKIEVAPSIESSFNVSSLNSFNSSLLMDKKETTVQALYPWQAKKDNHLSFAKGDIIKLLSQQEMWWFGELDGKVGWFPKSYVKIFGEPEKDYSPTPPEVTMDFSSVKQPVLPSHEPKISDISQNIKRHNLEEFIVVAMFTYSSNVPGDLTFNQGDVFPAQKSDKEWWTGTLNGVTGIFPASYVQQMETLNKNRPERPSKPSSVNATKLQENKKPEIASVIATYPATGPEQLTLQPGQLIHVRKKSPSGWWEGELQVKGQKRRIGWFPANYVKLLGTGNTPEPDARENVMIDDEKTSCIGKAKALYNYAGLTGGDLSFQEGSVINLLEKTSDDWWKGEVNGNVGIFPASYVTPISNKSSNNSLNALS